MSNIDKRAVQAVADLKAGYTLGHADVEIIQQMALDAVTLLDELEAMHKYAKDRDAENEGLMITVGRLRVEKEAAESRIAELEAKKVKIKLPESFYPDGDIDCPLVINEYQIIEAIVAAGCKPIAVCPRCKCELDLSHKPDGAHYCHPAAADKGE